jgi:peptide/nickel transport system substrate-binding protein
MHPTRLRSTRRNLILGAAGAAAGVTLASLGSRRAAALSMALQDPQKGGTLTYAFIEKPRSLDPNVWTGRSDHDVMRQIFDSLVYSPTPGDYQPWLAESWDISPDGLVYTFNLRKDVTFQDGTPFNAAAIQSNFERILDPATKSLQVGALGPYDRSEALGDYQFAIHLKEPFAPLMANLSSTPLSPMSPAAIQKYGDQYSQNPVGTGPFMFDKWEGNDLHLARNPNYNWAPKGMDHQGPAYLDAIVIREVAEPATRMVALQTKEANITHYPVLDQVASFKDSGFQVFQVNTPGFVKCMPINMHRAPTDDLAVRQAILYGINRQQVIDVVQAGLAEVAYGPLTRATFGYDPAVESYYNFDPEKAGALLDQAGWKDSDGDGIREKDGQPLHLDMIMFEDATNKAVAELVQAMLTELGFDTALDITSYDAFAARVTEGTYNLAEMNWTALDPHVPIFNMLHSGEVTGGGQFNRTRIEDPKLDDLIDRARSSSDTEERKSLYSEIQKFVVENALILPLWDNSWITIAAPEVKGLRFDLEGRPLLYNVWVE